MRKTKPSARRQPRRVNSNQGKFTRGGIEGTRGSVASPSLALSKVERERVEALARSAPTEAPKPPPKEAPAKQAARAFDYLSGLSAGTGKGSTHRPK